MIQSLSLIDIRHNMQLKINKASSMMAVIRRSFITLNTANFTPLYKTIMRCHLEYASCIWSHFKQKHKDAYRVQRRATKQLPGMKELSYLEKLKLLDLPTLVYRRTRGDMIKTYKLLHKKYNCDISNLATPHANCTSRESVRGHSMKLHL